MILSHKHQFIFIKTNKTAGTSIEIALSKYCGPDDIITPIVPEDEKIRQELGYPGPQNYEGVVEQGVISTLLNKFKKKRNLNKFYNHMPAKEVKDRIDKEVWENYFKFCVERNPWDRVMSLYYWRCRTEPRPTIQEYVASKAPRSLKRKGFGLYTIGGEVVVDKVCLYENLAEELDEVRRMVGIPNELELPRAKSQYRPEKKSYTEVFGEEENQIITELFADEIKLFGYQFDK